MSLARDGKFYLENPSGYSGTYALYVVDTDSFTMKYPESYGLYDSSYRQYVPVRGVPMTYYLTGGSGNGTFAMRTDYLATINNLDSPVVKTADKTMKVAMHWGHRFNHMVSRYNEIYKVQMPNITPHVCRHTYCSNMAKSGMNPKTLQYLMGHSDISVTMNVYTHISFDDAEEELKRMEEFRKAQAEIEKKNDAKAVSQKMFKVV